MIHGADQDQGDGGDAGRDARAVGGHHGRGVDGVGSTRRFGGRRDPDGRRPRGTPGVVALHRDRGAEARLGAPTRESDFDGTTVPPDWHPYGPEPGHNEKGTRTPEAVTVADGR